MSSLRLPAVVIATLLLAGCGPTAGTPTAPATSAPLEVKLMARSGSELTGTATFSAVEGGVKVAVAVQNVPPGKHGCHIHEKADCSAADGKSAGGHFNPGGHDHGLPDGRRHLGDLGNIEVGEDGTGKIEIVIEGANLTPGDHHSFVGRGIIVHAQEDDGGQPTGNAGGRIGCGEITGDTP